MRLSFLVCGLVLVASCGEAKPPPAPSPLITSIDKKTGCTLRLPRVFATRPATAEPVPAAKAWGTATMTWSGGCVNKRANGDGVARILSGGKVVGAWYGEARDGALGTGVIEDSYGYEAGKMAATGKMLTLHPDSETAAIKRAALAARALADRYDRETNKGSAGYYRTKADDIDAMLLGE